MMFCPKCGAMLMPKNVGGKNIVECSCGYTDKKVEVVDIKEEIKQKETIAIATDEDNMLPITDAECSKCGHGEAYYWLIQTRAGDEPETKFLRCTKCKHTWRDYS